MKRRKFSIAAIYDTETCNIINRGKNGNILSARAYPILFIDNDIREVNLSDYECDRDDFVSFYRHENEYLEKISDYIRWGLAFEVVPVICAYNLMFDLQPLMESLSCSYDIQVNAQSSTNVYTLDLYESDSDRLLLRFWDTFHLDMRGLERMGEVAGLEKAVGSWDYDKIRTPDTPLTEQELYYAKRDTQVIPMYLRFLLRTNDWLTQDMLGNKVLTKTSLVRQMARHDIGTLKVKKENGKTITVEKMFLELCRQEMPKTYNSYALRKSCFRGGYTFTAAANASVIVSNVVSVDVTSMHHTFINGRMLPDKFKNMKSDALLQLCNRVLSTTKEQVLEHYERPFACAFHARIRIGNIRLRADSAFEHWGIALEPMSKFKPKRDYSDNEARYEGEQALIDDGWHDTFINAVFAFGKLYSADSIEIHVTEIELWAMSRVYEWDSLEVVYGEGTMSFVKPPDYVTLQSNVLYRLKDDNKFVTNHYVEGVPYQYHIPDGIPQSYKDGLADGSLSAEEFNAYYISDTKGKFNGIYGTMAQDVYKPSYACKHGVIGVDSDTVVTRKNWDNMQPETCRVLYTYGMRIVGGSRLHMVLAIEQLYETFGDAVSLLGGDTDSMKFACDDSITDAMIEESLHVFEVVSKQAIDRCMVRVRNNYPKLASSLRGIGGFEVENEGKHYKWHIEMWNKCRVSVTEKLEVHITCAGLARPHGKYHIERFIADLSTRYNIERVLELSVGYNVFVSNEICHALETHRPSVRDRYNASVTDYLGSTSNVDVHESVCLYPTGRWLGETLKQANSMSVEYLQRVYGRNVNTDIKYLQFDGENAFIECDSSYGKKVIMMGGSTWSKN